MIAVAGGSDIRCAPYATFGTQQLSDLALAALEGRRACLLANHGMIAVAESISGAFALAVEVEALAEQFWRALQIGEPNVLSEAEMARVMEKFQSYGRPAKRIPPRKPQGSQ
jgi:L-fuculose-phosphate aldolase